MLGWLAGRLGIERLAELPEGVVAQRRGKFTLLFNFSDQAQTAVVAGRAVVVEGRGVSIS